LNPAGRAPQRVTIWRMARALGGAGDEAPTAYKRLDAVLAARGDTIAALHRLTAIGVATAAADTFDPYKDRGRWPAPAEG
jgi:hypothetical protein